MWKTCVDCGKPFSIEADEVWKTRCLPCWKRWKAHHEDPQAMSGQSLTVDPRLEQKSKEINLLQCEKINLERENSELNGLKRELAARLRQLVGLCHPDKHGGAEIASDMTTWLLGLRDRFGWDSRNRLRSDKIMHK